MTRRRDPAARDPDPQSDWAARLQALDPSRSFIVQAPAGSGKTELLIQRYLALLSRVGSPEEIAAITFTRKAAAEMRERVLDALSSAHGDTRPAEAHRALTWEHARAALERDAALGWRLEHNAARLRIQTIDALCASLTHQMPVLSCFGAQPESISDARPLFREAARATLALLDQQGAAAEDVATLLAHLDNDVALAEGLIAGMLSRRDHWVRNLVGSVGIAQGARERDALEAALAAVRVEAMERALSLLPTGEIPELLALACYAADNLAARAAGAPDSPILECADLAALPGADEAAAFAWLGLAELLLTAEGDWRKAANVNLGFPPGEGKAGKALAKQWKERHAALLARLSAEGALRDALHRLRRMPPARYTDAQWEALGAMARLLPLALANLKLVFGAHGEADFVEVAQGALAALGEPDAPTDLLLALDYRIRHILVDEFQDTSFTQYELLQKLTSGWQGGPQGGDGRTLFLVGDPMQSIYRFRQAEVGLFMKARDEGVGQVKLDALALSANFRSQAGIVDWVNHAFPQVMPQEENIAAGAVRYSASRAVHPAQPGAVCVHAFFEGDLRGEAERVVSIIESARSEDARATVAVLVRSRSHLREIVPRLKARALRFRAIEIEALGHRQVVQDLLALTRALAHPADRVAWLALLRAPWCGLTLADLGALCAAGAPGGTASQDDFPAEKRDRSRSSTENTVGFDHRTVWELLHDPACLARLSGDGRLRIEGGTLHGGNRPGLREVLARAMANRMRGSLRDRVEGAWLALGGPACVEDDADLEDASAYLDFLEASEEAGEIGDPAAFEEALAELHAQADPNADERLQIMTIHKAKGLEFDTVIVPGLGSTSKSDERELFVWAERLAPGGSARLLLAPINPRGSDKDAIYEAIRDFGMEKARHEEGRLLYVAATRAKRALHLLGSAGLDVGDAGPKPPDPRSLLARLWPVVGPEFARAAQEACSQARNNRAQSAAGAATAATLDQDLRRLPSDWIFPEPPAALRRSARADSPGLQNAIEFSWAGETARHIGSVVHRWLQRVADDGVRGWSRARVESLRQAFRSELAVRGVREGDLDSAAARVAGALEAALEDPRGRWVLGPQQHARNEYRITAMIGGERHRLVIDRAFTDGEGRRWVIDYKTSIHEGAGLDDFLDRERERYGAQIARYALVAGASMLGLYFPLVPGWREWAGDAAGEAAAESAGD